MREEIRIGAVALGLASLLGAGIALGDVTVTDVGAWKAQQRTANQQKKVEKRLRRSAASSTGRVSALATGSQALVDASGLEYFINTNITFSTTSSASGAMSEASYTGPVDATTAGGGVSASTLNDSFDGYFTIALSQTATGPVETGSSDYVIYNQNGPATVDPACNGRQVVFNPRTMFGLVVSRKVFVPVNDSFARWMTILQNPTGSPITVNVISANNLGSDSSTTIDTTSSGDTAATTADTWITSFQSYSGSTSSDPRLGHVIYGAGGLAPSFMSFVNGDDNPYWSFPVTVPAGATRILLHFVTGQPSKAAARAKAASLAANPIPPTATSCLTDLERTQLVNFAAFVGEPPIPSLGTAGLLALVAAIGAAGFLAQRRAV